MSATILEQLESMRSLPPNWDGYNADPPDPRVIDLAKEFVSLITALRPTANIGSMYVSPGRAGGVLIEWSDERTDHEVEIEPSGTWGFLHVERSTGKMVERRFRSLVHPEMLREIVQLMAA